MPNVAAVAQRPDGWALIILNPDAEAPVDRTVESKSFDGGMFVVCDFGECGSFFLVRDHLDADVERAAH